MTRKKRLVHRSCEGVLKINTVRFIHVIVILKLIILEYAYTFKYPELKIRKTQTTGAEPWRLRQTAVYHQYRFESNQSFWILLNPVPNSPAHGKVYSLLEHLDFPSLSCRSRHAALDNAIISTYLDNWRPYLAYYETKLLPMVRYCIHKRYQRLNMSKKGMMYGTRLEQKVSVDFDAMTNVHYVKSRILPLKPILACFNRDMEQLEIAAANIRSIGNSCSHCTHDSQRIAYAKEKSVTIQSNADYLLEQCSSTFEILSKRLEFVDKDEVRKQSAYLLQLTKSAVDDSAAVRVITFITLIYLSGTVVGVSKIHGSSGKNANCGEPNRRSWECHFSSSILEQEPSKYRSTSGYILSYRYR